MKYHKWDFSGVLFFVEKHKKPGDKVATVGMVMLPYNQYLEANWKMVISKISMVNSDMSF